MAAELWVRVGAEGRAAYPEVALTDERLAALLADRNLEGPLACADLFLACACAEGVPAALARFERDFLGRVGQMLGRVERAPEVIDEVQQRVRVRLLVGADGEAPRIGSYRGKGALAVWVRVTALREHQNLLRSARPAGAIDEDFPDLSQLSPELAAAHAQHRGAIEEALRSALRALPRRQRLVLRMAYVDGMPLAAIGRVFAVDKGTVSRWLSATRDDLLAEVVARVVDATGATPAEVKSLLRFISGEIEVSLAGLLRSAPQEA